MVTVKNFLGCLFPSWKETVMKLPPYWMSFTFRGKRSPPRISSKHYENQKKSFGHTLGFFVSSEKTGLFRYIANTDCRLRKSKHFEKLDGSMLCFNLNQILIILRKLIPESTDLVNFSYVWRIKLIKWHYFHLQASNSIYMYKHCTCLTNC